MLVAFSQLLALHCFILSGLGIAVAVRFGLDVEALLASTFPSWHLGLQIEHGTQPEECWRVIVPVE